jgi:hypothetical protein
MYNAYLPTKITNFRLSHVHQILFFATPNLSIVAGRILLFSESSVRWQNVQNVENDMHPR